MPPPYIRLHCSREMDSVIDSAGGSVSGPHKCSIHFFRDTHRMLGLVLLPPHNPEQGQENITQRYTRKLLCEW